jgi:hypothetical protein
MSAYLEQIAEHYADVWGRKGEVRRWLQGPVYELPEGFHVLVFAPTPERRMWTYATCGMSQPGDARPLETHLFAPHDSESLVELLTVVAHYHRTGAPLGLGHTVNFGRPWLDDSHCEYGLLSLPYLDGPPLEWLELGDVRIQFLWLIPITRQERDYKKQHGLEKLEELFERQHFDYLDPKRPSVV